MNILVVGGAGFIGVNLSEYYLKQGYSVTALDNLSRVGTQANIQWLQETYPAARFVKADIRYDHEPLGKEVARADVVFHLAAQVAVTTSVKDPRGDFEINALGSFNVLEAARNAKKPPILFYSSTNKVYGGMEDIVIVEKNNRYAYRDLPGGIPENKLLDFHSPYGCSKGCADQYFRDYARIYGLKTIVFRQSCIYGKRQFGIEDQGWVAWFTIASALNKPITIYGDGKQVRDVLEVNDLIQAFELARQNIDVTAGQVYNVGGGSQFCMSLLELVAYLEEFLGRKIPYQFDDWRPGDQKVYVSDIAKAKKDFGWEPKRAPFEGVNTLYEWVQQNKNLFDHL